MQVHAETALAYIEDKRHDIVKVSDRIWEEAELALHEYKSARILREALADEGFEIESGISQMPTAFSARWGEGRPVIAYLGEYDALADMSQEPVPERKPGTPGAPGHACGHNLLGAGSLAAALGLKQEMQHRKLPGTVIYFGCPAEENLSGKAFMARDGAFDDCDACFCWHPAALNMVWGGSSLANNAANITFRGISAHAAGAPEQGRSALDAVQLMNMGAEFLREHIPDQARLHYAITDGGGQPNVVPDRAQVWYLVRAPRREQVDDIYRRVLRCASGAAEMTETEYEVDLLKAIHEILPNRQMEGILAESMQAVGAPGFTEKEHEFATGIAATFPDRQMEAELARENVPEDVRDRLLDRPLHEDVLDERRSDLPGSTDVGDVSWCCPTGQISTACLTVGTPGHSWQYTAQAGMSIGHRGMIAAGKILAEAGYRLMKDPEQLERVHNEFARRTDGKPYRSAMPPEQQPAFDQFANARKDGN